MASIESDGHEVVEHGASRAVRWMCAASALVAAGLFFVLGNMLGHRPDPAGLLTLEASWVNHGSLVAWWFTWLGYAYVLAPLSAALLIVAWRFPTWRGRIALSIVLLLVCWRGADFFQHFFARPRRLDWVVKHETAFGYPSSHAAIATGFYLLWSLLAGRSDLPGRWWWSALLAGTAIGIMWSRLALGAHYLTDVAGGVLLAGALVMIAAALFPRIVLGRPAGRP